WNVFERMFSVHSMLLASKQGPAFTQDFFVFIIALRQIRLVIRVAPIADKNRFSTFQAGELHFRIAKKSSDKSVKNFLQQVLIVVNFDELGGNTDHRKGKCFQFRESIETAKNARKLPP